MLSLFSITNYITVNINEHAGVLDIIQLSDKRIAFSTNHGIVLLQENRRKDKIRAEYLINKSVFDYTATRALYQDTLTNILWAGKVDSGSIG